MTEHGDLLRVLCRQQSRHLHRVEVPLALGLPPGDSAFRDLVNMTLLAMKADRQFDTIYSTWFDDTPVALEDWPGSPYRPLSLR